MLNLFAFKGAQDYEMIQEQQYTSPEILTIPFNKSLSLRYGDLIKIKGFIVKKDVLNTLMDEELEITFGSTYFTPFLI